MTLIIIKKKKKSPSIPGFLTSLEDARRERGGAAGDRKLDRLVRAKAFQPHGHRDHHPWPGPLAQLLGLPPPEQVLARVQGGGVILGEAYQNLPAPRKSGRPCSPSGYPLLGHRHQGTQSRRKVKGDIPYPPIHDSTGKPQGAARTTSETQSSCLTGKAWHRGE